MNKDVCFFVSKRDYSRTHTAEILDYTLYHEPIGRNKSSVKCYGNFELPQETLAIIGSDAWIVSKCTPNESEQTTDVRMEPILNLFDRDIAYVDQPEYTEDLLKDAIKSNFTDCTDALYSLPYVSTISAQPTIPRIEPDIKNGFYNLKSYMETVSTLTDLRLWMVATPYGLELRIIRRTDIYEYPQLRVFVPDLAQITAQSFESNIIGKITNKNTKVDPMSVTDYYLLTDGSITTKYTLNNRVAGKWTVVENYNDDKIAETFKKAELSHSITIMYSEMFNYGDPCRIVTKTGKVVNSVITSVKSQKGNNRYEYKCGKAITRLTEILNETR